MLVQAELEAELQTDPFWEFELNCLRGHIQIRRVVSSGRGNTGLQATGWVSNPKIFRGR
jgi:hypothetical protein